MKTHIKLTILFIAMLINLLPAQFQLPVNAAEEEILYWVAPMDPNYRRDKPGKSPLGMDLVPVYADGDDGGSTVTIAPEVVQSLGVRTTKAERTKLWRGIDTVGYVDYDESKVSHIHLRTEGWIENLKVQSEGERVKKGQLLFELYSPELVNAQQEYVAALASGNKNLKRASKQRLVALGISDIQIAELQKDKKIKQRISVYAPQDGVVSTLPVREGMFIKPAKRVMSLGDLSSVWLLADVFERQADWVKVGQPAEVRLTYLPGNIWEGTVEYIYPNLDPKTRSLKVRLRFDNPDETLKPNMYANVKIYGGPKENTIAIPLEGLIRTGREERVIISLGEGKFEARKVTAGIETGDYVEIIKGVDEGDDIVISGQFLIDSEASLRASLTRMSDMGSTMSDKDESTMEMKTVSGSGVIKAIKTDEHKLNMEHGPIEELGWPSMTMDFQLAEDVSLEGLNIDDSIMFDLEQRGNDYRITSIHRMEDTGSGNKGMQP